MPSLVMAPGSYYCRVSISSERCVALALGCGLWLCSEAAAARLKRSHVCWLDMRTVTQSTSVHITSKLVAL